MKLFNEDVVFRQVAFYNERRRIIYFIFCFELITHNLFSSWKKDANHPLFINDYIFSPLP